MIPFLSIPLSWCYTAGVTIRHWLFDKQLLPSHTVAVPTICVGNLAVGGTGKTPMVEYLVRLLIANGFRPAVLSRGYKRKTHGFQMADSMTSVERVGDEPMQLHRKFPDIPIAVCEHRIRGVKQLQRQVPDIDVVILDDAFQHRAIRCGLNILLTPYDRLYIDDHMLPWGTLRDLPSRALKADAIVVTKCPNNMRPIDMRVVDNRLHLPTYQQLHFASIAYEDLVCSGTPLVLCGIARPDYLLEHVRTLYPQAQLLAFPDHHRYTAKDIQTILQKAGPFSCVVTTEKDAERLHNTDLETRLHAQGKTLVVLPIRNLFRTPAKNFDRQILTYVREYTRK